MNNSESEQKGFVIRRHNAADNGDSNFSDFEETLRNFGTEYATVDQFNVVMYVRVGEQKEH